MATETFRPGDKVTWRHVPPRGYGYVFRVPGVVLAVGPRRVKIEVVKAGGGKAVRLVKPESLAFLTAE